jgi:hypothetical protein
VCLSQACTQSAAPEKKFKKTKDFVEVIILNALLDLPFSRSEPLKLDNGYSNGILKNKVKNLGTLRRI